MKLCKLKLKNLNSFREEQEINFEESPLDDAPLVAITGPTGSGKTTILDGICVALYGKTPRLSSTSNQHPRHLISHGETESSAELYFEASGTRYHAVWTIKRNRPPRSQLFSDSGELITTHVSQEVESILGLDFAAFNRSVMLAQGEFAAFLKAGKEDRRTILEATANIYIYDKLRARLNDKVNEVKDAYEDVIRKRDQIPEATSEQIEQENVELNKLRSETKTLTKQNQQIQKKSEKESKRKEAFEKLQSSEESLIELNKQQTEIDKLKIESVGAELANQLRPEKQAFDSAKTEQESVSSELDKANTEFTDTQKEVENNKVDFNKKKESYDTASSEHDDRIIIFREAISYVERATDRFTEVNKRTPTLEDLNKQINTSSSQLEERETRQEELKKQITESKNFLDENHLPSDRQSRLNRATALLVEINLQREQQKEKTDDQLQYMSKIGELEKEVNKLSENREKLQLEEKTLTNSHKESEAKYKKLQANGTLEDWQNRRDKVRIAQPIAQQYEISEHQLSEKKNNIAELQESTNALDESLTDIEKKLEIQFQLCKREEAEVQKFEAEKELALLTEPVNSLRQQLEEGKPCRVCGSTEHPNADKVELHGEELLENIERALTGAETKVKKAQEQKQNLEQEQVRLQQDKSNTTKQVNACTEEIENLITETEDLLTQWQELYESVDISCDWVEEKFNEADTAINDFNAASEKHNEVLAELKTVTQKLETCERDLDRESKLLENTEQDLDTVTDEIEDLKADIVSTEESFWTSIPDVFHGTEPNVAVVQFSEKIDAVDSHERKLTTMNNQLNVLDSNIANNKRELLGLTERKKGVETEIKRYKDEAEDILQDVRDKTNGMETEDEINANIDKLDAELKETENARDEADEQLQENLRIFTQKETTQRIRKKQLVESNEKFKKARDAYFVKLDDAGFDSPAAHEDAFREETQIQEITDKIDDHEDEKQQLISDITELQTQFDDSPYDSQILEQIKSQAEEIDVNIQKNLEEIGAQQQKINSIEDNLKKREGLKDEVNAAEQEMKRWVALREEIPINTLRDFALEIIFKQMGRFANERLRYLTSDRYQLKVESIGDLTVIDRWNANEERPVQTLSGGESFLTSLALALALTEISQGRAQLNSLFLDEGFGTLDTETLDIAIAALEGLRMQGRSIYLISHIQELTRRLPVKINVKKRGNGSSHIEIRD